MPPSPVESPAAYAKEAKEAYDQLPDSPETPSGKTLSVLSSTLRGVWDAFTKAKPFEKALIATGAVAVSAVTVYAGVKILEKGISLVKGTVDKLFSLGDKAQEEVAAVKEKSHERLIWTLLGTAAAGGLLYLLVAKVDLVDLFREAKNHPDGFVKGFLVAVTTRIVTGVLDEPGAWWDDLAEKWGLPNREELKQQRASRGKTLAKAAREKLSEAVDMVSEFDEKSGLKVLRERTFKSLDNRFPGWQENDTMKAIHALKDPSQVMNWLDLNTPEKRAAFYAEASVKAAEGVGVGIGSYLLMKLFSTPYSGLISGLNMGLYFVLQQEGVSTSVVHGIETLEESVNAAHGEVKKIFNHLGLKPEWLGLQDEGWGLKSALDFVLNMAKDHPGFAVLAVLDGAILSRKLIAAVVVGSIEFMFKASGATAQFIMEHKTASGILLGVGALTVIERRQVIADLAQLLHPDSSEQRRAFIDDMTRYLNASKILALPKEPEFKEAALLPFYEGLVKNPVAFLSNPERRFQLFKSRFGTDD